MPPGSRRHLSCAALAAGTLVLLAGAASADNRSAWRRRADAVTITRDDWGVAHVSGRTDADAVFGMLYAQAEDDFARIERNFLVALGRLAEAEGEAALWQDLRARLFVDEADLRRRYRASPGWLRALLDAHADGLNYFLATHAGVHPRVLTRFEPWMVLAFTEGSIGADVESISLPALRDLYGDARDQAAAAPTWAPVDRSVMGSNGIALAPSRSASGKALLLINPHTTFYFRSEQHVRSQEGLDAYGAATWGQLFLYQGWNRRCGWMHTSSGVDAIDEFRETFVEKQGRRFYRTGAAERPVELQPVILSVKDADGRLAQRRFTVLRTHHGPIVRSEGGTPISVALMFRPVEALTQAFLRTKARGLADFLAASEQRANSSNNTIFADADGHIAYLHPQFIPRRDDRFDYTQPVDGADPASDWQGLHATSEAPRVIDPPVGHVVNTNDWPYSAAGADSPRREAFPRYMDTQGPNARGAHAAALLAQRTFSRASLLAAAFDDDLPAFHQLVPQLVAAHEALPGADARRGPLAGPIAVLRGWDRRSGEASEATTLAVLWAEELRARHEAAAARARLPLVEHLAALPAPTRLEALAAVVARLEQDFGRWRVPWGDLNRLQREPTFDDERPSVPVGFTPGRWGSLASFDAARGPTTKRLYGRSGNSFVAVVELGQPVTAEAVSVGGASSDPASPHHRDQDARYRTGALRRVYFSDEELRGHVVTTGHPGR